MMFIPNSPSPPRGTTCSFRSDIDYVGIARCWVPGEEPGTQYASWRELLGRLVDGAERIGAREAGRNNRGGRIASRMAVAAGTDLLAGATVDEDVIEHIVVAGYGDRAGQETCGWDTRGHTVGDVIQIQKIAHLPGDDVIGTGRIAADAESAHDLLAGLPVEGESAAEDVDAANLLADEGVSLLTVE